MIRFYFLSILYFLGSGGLLSIWIERMEDWGWLVATIIWVIVAGGALFDQGQRAEQQSKQ